MSLINQMLQDLEQRNASANKNEPLSGEVRARPAASTPRLGRLAGLVLLVVAVIAGGGWVFMQPNAAPPAMVVLAPPAAIPAVAIAVPSVAPPVVAPAPAPATAPKSSPMPPQVAAAVAVVPQPAPVVVATHPVVAQAVTKKPSNLVTEEASAPVAKAKPVAAPVPESRLHKRVNPQQQSDNLYKQAVAQFQQGRGNEVKQSLHRALEANPNNAQARQLLTSLLVEGNQLEEASALLREGLKLSPDQSDFSMTLARLQLESGDTQGGISTLEQGLASAGEEPQYRAFYAALLQRAERHEETVRHYVVALRTDPAMPTWLVGIGISLQALGKNADAAEAFQRARDGGLLNPQLSQFVEQRLSQLKR